MDHKLLVPVDFREPSANAVKHALRLAPQFNTGIALLHIVADDSHKAEGREQMDNFVAGFKTDIPIKKIVQRGDLFEDIGQAADILEAYMIVMGTSGLRGLQYVFGSRALRIVTSATTPFMVVQTAPPRIEIKTMVVPVDLAREDKQILSLAIQATRLLGTKIHLFVAHHTDDFKRNDTYRNEKFAQRYLDEFNVEYTTVHAEGKHDFTRELLEYSDLVEAGLIGIVNHREEGFMNLLGNNFDQKIITNESEIPVLIINAYEHSRIKDIFDGFLG